jgi:hypothetical protein
MPFSFQYQQDNLEEICRDRPLVTPEKHKANDFYGQASILKRYCGIKESKSLKLVYEHSLKLHSVIWEHDLKTRFSTAFTSSFDRYICFKNSNKFKLVIPIGPPILYAKDIVEQELKKKDTLGTGKREGTIVFPSHSTHHISAEFDRTAFVKQLVCLGDEFKPIVICIYWKDYLDGKHEIYEDHGFKVVSAGHIYDKNFLLRFYDICRQFKYSYANNLGSDLFYSTLSGCQHFCDYQLKVDHRNPNKFEIYDGNIEVNRNKLKAQLLFNVPSELTLEKSEFIEFISGASFKRSRKVLKSLILVTELVWKLNVLRNRGWQFLNRITK